MNRIDNDERPAQLEGHRCTTEDHVACTNCQWAGWVKMGEETCPACKMTGSLQWFSEAGNWKYGKGAPAQHKD